MTQEQKAKAYDEARKKIAIRFGSNVADEIFSQFEMSEGERIRKALINGFNKLDKSAVWYNGITNAQILAWLEKQGEQKSIDDLTQQEAMDIAVAKCFEQGEQKPADKVEPKFKIGDWVVYDHRVYKVVTLPREGCINLGLKRNGKFEFAPFTYCRPWTIADAKPGDVLFQDLMGGKTFIYNGVNPDMAILYSFIISNDGEDVLPYHIGKPNTGIGNIEENKNIIHPATKEQSNLLFQKMKEAGYEWDAEKKELKKIEQKYWSEEDEGIYQSIMDDTVQENQLNDKQTNWLRDIKYRYFPQPRPAWSEEDEKILNNLISSLARIGASTRTDSTSINYTFSKEINWLNSLKDRVGCEVNCTTTKEWGEEHERIYKSIIYSFAHNYPLTVQQQDFIKSIRPQNTWKPSDEQIEALEHFIVYHNGSTNYAKDLEELRLQLKKLKE